MSAPAGTSGLYEAIVTMLIESCALYTVNSLLCIISWAAHSWVVIIFLPLLAQIQVSPVSTFSLQSSHDFGGQVIAPMLIILRAAEPSASASNTAEVPTTVGSIRFGYHGNSMDGDEIFCELETTS